MSLIFTKDLEQKSIVETRVEPPSKVRRIDDSSDELPGSSSPIEVILLKNKFEVCIIM